MSVSINTSLNLLATSLLIGQPPSPDQSPGRSLQQGGNTLLDDILRGTDKMIQGTRTPSTPGSPTTTGGSTTTTTTTASTSTSAPTPQDIERIAPQNRTWFGIQSRIENGRTVFFHPSYGTCIQQLDGSYFFPEPTSEGQRTQPFTVQSRQVINNSRPLHGTISINHFNLRPLNNWIFTDSEGSVHFLQPDGTFWDLGVKTDGTRVRNSRIINGTQVVEGGSQPLPWTLAMAQLGLYPVQNTDGSFTRPGDNRRYYLQTDGTIFREGYTNGEGVQVAGATYVNNSGTLQWDLNRSQPLPNTLTLASGRATPPGMLNLANVHAVPLFDGTWAYRGWGSRYGRDDSVVVHPETGFIICLTHSSYDQQSSEVFIHDGTNAVRPSTGRQEDRWTYIGRSQVASTGNITFNHNFSDSEYRRFNQIPESFIVEATRLIRASRARRNWRPVSSIR